MQWKRFRRILRHAYNNVPFYREKFDRAGITPAMIRTRKDLERIPLTTREEIQREKHLLAKGYTRNNCYSSSTSGSKGQPFTSYFDQTAWAILKYASKARARFACGLRPWNRVVNINAMSPERAEFEGGLCKMMRYCSINDPINKHIDCFKQFRPKALYSFPSYFSQLAQHSFEPKPKLLFTSAELLDPTTQRVIEKSFGDKHFDIYGSTEFKELSWECSCKEGYHINEELFLVEFARTHGQVSTRKNTEGSDGDIIVTSLMNKALPLIRYVIGDRGVRMPGMCSCGRSLALMRPTCGRSVDYFSLPDGREVSPYVLTTAIENIQNVRQYQFIQRTINTVVVRICAKTLSRKDRSLVRNNLRAVLGSAVTIQIELVKVIPREKSGKYRVAKSMVKRK